MEGFWAAVLLLTIFQVTGTQDVDFEYSVRSGDCPGNDIWSIYGDGITLQQCADRCSGHSDCVAFMFYDNRRCFPKSKTCEETTNDNPMNVFYDKNIAFESQIRLVGAPDDVEEEGRLEVRAVDTKDWGTVCSQGFDMNDAKVACKMLGFGEPKHIRDSSYYGQVFASRYQGSDDLEIKMANLGCSGVESSLFNCPYDGPDSHSCSHGEDVGLVCGGVMTVGVIVGIVFGLLIVLAIITTIIYLCVCRKNKIPGRVLGPAVPSDVQSSNVTYHSNTPYPMHAQQDLPFPQQQIPAAYQPNQPGELFPPPPSYDQATKPSYDQLYPK